MTRNLRTQLANAAERWMRAWAGDDLARESAEVLYTYWDLADPNDDELRAEVLSRFPAAEPPAVAGLDWLPAVEADAKTIVAESLPERTTCGNAFIGNVGEFTCDHYSGHEGRHRNYIAEFEWGGAS